MILLRCLKLFLVVNSELNTELEELSESAFCGINFYFRISDSFIQQLGLLLTNSLIDSKE